MFKNSLLILLSIFLVIFAVGNFSLIYKKSLYSNISLEKIWQEQKSASVKTELDLLKPCDTSNQPGKSYNCVISLVKPIIQAQGLEAVNKIYSEIYELQYKGEIKPGECHEISHEIGKQVYLSNKNLVTELGLTLNTENLNCVYGYYHGLLIGYMSVNKNSAFLNSNLKKLLQELAKDPEGQVEYEQTMHAIGHALQVNNDSLSENLEKCSAFADGKRQDLYLCASGVFMQDASTKNLFGLELAPDYCDAYTDTFKRSCFWGQVNSSVFLTKHLNDFASVCNSQNNQDEKYNCQFSNLHHIVINNLQKGIFYEHQFCDNFSGNDKINCLILAAKNFSESYPNINKKNIIENFCVNLPLLNYLKCRKNTLINSDQSQSLFYSEEDKKIPSLNFLDIKYIFD